ncbi:hypothetical protein P4H94_28270, partial [Paenibacillus macerans]|uniref:hypothetical protein n=1 Tax=Paenibacillus macerans TaxID=44252 RepID=UPI002DB9ED3D
LARLGLARLGSAWFGITAKNAPISAASPLWSGIATFYASIFSSRREMAAFHTVGWKIGTKKSANDRPTAQVWKIRA